MRQQQQQGGGRSYKEEERARGNERQVWSPRRAVCRGVGTPNTPSRSPREGLARPPSRTSSTASTTRTTTSTGTSSSTTAATAAVATTTTATTTTTTTITQTQCNVPAARLRASTRRRAPLARHPWSSCRLLSSEQLTPPPPPLLFLRGRLVLSLLPHRGPNRPSPPAPHHRRRLRLLHFQHCYRYYHHHHSQSPRSARISSAARGGRPRRGFPLRWRLARRSGARGRVGPLSRAWR